MTLRELLRDYNISVDQLLAQQVGRPLGDFAINATMDSEYGLTITIQIAKWS